MFVIMQNIMKCPVQLRAKRVVQNTVEQAMIFGTRLKGGQVSMGVVPGD
jgi:hypothetical protein